MNESLIRSSTGRRTALVTGASSGIGLAASRALVARGWTVLMHARTRDRGEAAARRVRASGSAGAVEVVVADLSDLDAVHRLADEHVGRPLHALVHNACTTNFHGACSEQGHELTFAVGQLAAFTLTARLMPTLRRSEPSCVVWVGSQSHRLARRGFVEPFPHTVPTADAAYARTKLANLVTCFELARRLEPTLTRSLAFDPGPTNTPMMETLKQQNTGLKRLLLRVVVPLVAREPDDVGEALAWTVEQGVGRRPAQGRYFGVTRRPIGASARARDPEVGAALFERCERDGRVSMISAAPVNPRRMAG